MPSFADLKDRAVKAKDASVHKISNTRDKYTSTSSKNLDWDPNHKRPPPPPAAYSRTKSAVNTPPPPVHASAIQSPVPTPTPPPAPARAPPIIRRDTRPDQTPPVSPPQPASYVPQAIRQTQSVDKIDWTNLSPEDKEAFFSWLDEFFERYLNIKIPPRKAQPSVQVSSRPITPLRPPSIPRWSRPSQPVIPADTGSFTLSYPPPTTYGSAALDLAHFFSPSTHWDTPWYLSSDLPPPLQTNAPPSWSAAWEMRGSTKTTYGGILFSDLSMCWYSVSFSTTNTGADPNNGSLVKRSAQYLPRPAVKDQATLVEAHETYGETIAGFAESFEGTGQYCARGECWDLANEALKFFEQYDYVPKPVPSIGRTHGHLIYEGKAEQNGAVQMGRWRGGDDRIRRGDIVEWRSVRVGMGPGGYAMLGSPDHTAVIVSDLVPSSPVSGGKSVRPSELGSVEVIEQSVGKPPARERYDLSQMQEGEVWIYRPISMEVYIGASLQPQCPDGVNVLTL